MDERRQKGGRKEREVESEMMRLREDGGETGKNTDRLEVVVYSSLKNLLFIS